MHYLAFPTINAKYPHSHLYFLQFRVVKIKTAENTYEYLITNLPFSFTLDDIQECYHWRWGIEISFRYVKHAAGLLYFHSKQPEFLKQEIYSRLILYNFGIFIANEAAEKNRKKKRDTPYAQIIDSILIYGNFSSGLLDKSFL